MSQKHIKNTSTGIDKAKLSATLQSSLAVRLVIASIIFAASLIIKLPDFVTILLLVAASVLAGYDIILKAVNAVEGGSYLDLPVLVVVISFLSFFIGYGIEGAAVVLLYQIGMLLIHYAKEHTKKAALELLNGQDEDTISHLRAVANDDASTNMAIENVMRSSAGSILKLAMLLAIAYAVALPLITNLSISIAIHRALMILLIATPFSVIVSIPMAGFVGLCRCAKQGAMFGSAYSMEAVADVAVAVFDKSGVFSEQCPRIVSMHSDMMDYSTFLNFVAHAVYYSEQPIANAVSALYDQDYKLEVIKDFREIPGCGVALSIDGIQVTFAESGFLRSRGLELPDGDDSAVGTTYYMVVAGKPMGMVVISSDVNQDLEDLVPRMKAEGISRCVLLSEESKEAAQHFAEGMTFSELHAECDTGKKFQIVQEIAQKTKDAVLFVYAYGFDTHSDAAVDIRVDKRAKAADASLAPEMLGQLPQLKAISRRVREISIENALFAFIVKTVLIFLCIIGYCNLWLALLVDLAAACATVLNSIRTSKESIRSDLKYKLGR